jgi:hypothetical protein
MSLTQTAWRWHRWLGWLIGLQVLLWVTSGVLFAWLPFEPWVKGGDDLKRPVLALTALPAGLEGIEPARVTALSAVVTPNGPAWRVGLKGEKTPRYVPLSGGAWAAPDAGAIERFALTLLQAPRPVLVVERLASVPPRLLIVEETGGRGDLWRVRFDDALGTRLYFDGTGGDFVTHRNEAWVWYDFFWRLHIMDYGGGEDFNNGLLRFASVVSWALVGAGVALSVLAARRALRRRQMRIGPTT